MHPVKKTLLLAFAGLCCAVLPAQSFESLRLEVSANDRAALRLEDKAAEHTRFSAPLDLDIAPAAAPDTYAYEDGEWTWSRTFHVSGATGLGLFLDRLNLPEGGRVTLTNDYGQQGPFTQANASYKQRLFTDFLPGEFVTITYRGPLPETEPFHLWRLDHIYRPDRWRDPRDKGFGDANDCHVNANCAAGDGWDDEKSGAARVNLVVTVGVGFCSGSLINNTAMDGRPYLLTGFHCMDGFTPLYDLWAIDFDYTGTGCDNPTEEPVPTRYVGVEERAGLQATDFLLLEITDTSFVTEDHYFAGWDRSPGDVSGPIIHFHHPFGDVQKVGVSVPEGMTVLTNQITWNSQVVTPPNHHFILDYAVGTFQQGSSGSVYFDEDHRVRGTLNGGNASCPGDSEAFVGRFHLSWDSAPADSSSLRPWLDPLGTNPMTLDGANLITQRFVSGQVTLEGEPLEGATIIYEWPPMGRVAYTTDANGFYRGVRPQNVSAFAISGEYERAVPSLEIGVDVSDLISVRRHLLNLSALSPQRLLAADVNSTGSVRVSDITRMTRVILNVTDWGDRPNWLVLPVGFPITPLPARPFEPIGISLNNRAVHEFTVDFVVLKTGDANGDVGN